MGTALTETEKKMALADFRFIMRFRVPFHDIDMLKHANHAAYIIWAESARCAYISEVLKQSIDGPQGTILAHLEFSYERPLDYLEEVAVGCRISRLGRKSFDFAYEIWSETHHRRAAHGVTSVVAYDYEKKASRLIPERMRKMVEAYEVVQPAQSAK
jgi:acyl-CoA thioester hydrolase